MAVPKDMLDGPRLKTPLDGEYATALAVIHRQQVAHAALAALVRRVYATVGREDYVEALAALLAHPLAYPLAEDTEQCGAKGVSHGTFTCTRPRGHAYAHEAPMPGGSTVLWTDYDAAALAEDTDGGA